MPFGLMITGLRLRLHGRSGLKLWCQSFAHVVISLRLHGRSGLKYEQAEKMGQHQSLRLHGRSGLKSEGRCSPSRLNRSPPTRAEWIEINKILPRSGFVVSPPTRAEWIEIPTAHTAEVGKAGSPPTRAEWIEIRAHFRVLSANPGLRLHGRSGLKSKCGAKRICAAIVSAYTGGVD